MKNFEDLLVEAKANPKALAELHKLMNGSDSTSNAELQDLKDQVAALQSSNEHLSKKQKTLERSATIKSDTVASMTKEVQDVRTSIADAERVTYLALKFLTDAESRTEKFVDGVAKLTSAEISERLEKLVGKDSSKYFKSLEASIKEVPPVKLTKTVDNPAGSTDNDNTSGESDGNDKHKPAVKSGAAAFFGGK